MKKAILHGISDGLALVAAYALKLAVKAEKAVFFRTGRRGRALAWAWNRDGVRLQKALNREHGTAIAYGYIVEG